MKKMTILVLAMISGFYGYSQSKSLMLEIGGNSLLASIGYENQFNSTESHISFYRVGIGFMPFDDNDVIVPLELGRILGKNKHHFEMSTGLTFITEHDELLFAEIEKSIGGKTITILWFNRIGYRYQKPDGRFIFRLGFTPLNARLNFWKKDGFFSFTPFGGIGFGYVFKGKKSSE